MYFQQGASVFARYRIIREVRRGGFAVVYEARDEWERRTVAIKILSVSAQQDDQARRRFAAECKVLTRLDHKHIVQIYEYQELAGNHVLIMEWCPTSIGDVITNQGKMDSMAAVETCKNVCDALQTLHAKGIIHRDVKPSNILLSVCGTIRLADMGIAHIPETSWGRTEGPRGAGTGQTPAALTTMGQQPGSLLYMAPEQIRGETVDHRADIYSLGATFFELLTGKWYLSDPVPRDRGEVASMILSARPRSLLSVEQSVPRTIDRLVMKALRKRPDERFSSAHDLAEALEACKQILQDTRESSHAGAGRRKSIWTRVTHLFPRKSIRYGDSDDSEPPRDTAGVAQEAASAAAQGRLPVQVPVDDKEFADLGGRELGVGLAIETLGGVATELLTAGRVVPCRLKQVFSTAVDDQTQIEIHFVAAVSSLTADCPTVCRAVIKGVAKSPKGAPRIVLSIDVDSAGRLTLNAEDEKTGRVLPVEALCGSKAGRPLA